MTGFSIFLDVSSSISAEVAEKFLRGLFSIALSQLLETVDNMRFLAPLVCVTLFLLCSIFLDSSYPVLQGKGSFGAIWHYLANGKLQLI